MASKRCLRNLTEAAEGPFKTTNEHLDETRMQKVHAGLGLVQCCNNEHPVSTRSSFVNFIHIPYDRYCSICSQNQRFVPTVCSFGRPNALEICSQEPSVVFHFHRGPKDVPKIEMNASRTSPVPGLLVGPHHHPTKRPCYGPKASGIRDFMQLP